MSEIFIPKIIDAISLENIHELLLDSSINPASVKNTAESRISNPFLTIDTHAKTTDSAETINIHSELSKWDVNPVLTVENTITDAHGKFLQSRHSEISQIDGNPDTITIESIDYAAGAKIIGSSNSTLKHKQGSITIDTVDYNEQGTISGRFQSQLDDAAIQGLRTRKIDIDGKKTLGIIRSALK